MNSPRIFLFIFLFLRLLLNAFLICAFVASSLTSNSVSLPSEVDDKPKYTWYPEVLREIDLWSLSKDELEDYGRTIGIELDRRHSKSKLVKELEDHIEYLKTV